MTEVIGMSMQGSPPLHFYHWTQMKYLHARLATVALLALPLAASAATTLISTAHAPVFSVIDLDTTDGIEAGISDVRYRRQYGVSAYPALPGVPGYHSTETTSSSPVHNHADTAWAYTQAGTTGPLGDFRQEVRTTEAFQQTSAFGMAWTSVNDTARFTIAPHTRVNVEYTITVNIDTQFDTEKLLASYYTSVHYGLDAFSPEGYSSDEGRQFNTPGSYMKEISFSGFIENNTDEYAQHAYFGVLSNLGAEVNTLPPVPEPGTYAMLLAGLGMVGFALRKRRS